MPTISTHTLNLISIDKKISIFNRYHMEYNGLTEYGNDKFKKRNKNEKVKFSETIYENGEFKTIKGKIKLKYISRDLHQHRVDLNQFSTRNLLNMYKAKRKHYFMYGLTSRYDYFYFENGITNLINLEKELNKREHVPNKKDSKKIRRICSTKKISREEAAKLLY